MAPLAASTADLNLGFELISAPANLAATVPLISLAKAYLLKRLDGLFYVYVCPFTMSAKRSPYSGIIITNTTCLLSEANSNSLSIGFCFRNNFKGTSILIVREQYFPLMRLNYSVTSIHRQPLQVALSPEVGASIRFLSGAA